MITLFVEDGLRGLRYHNQDNSVLYVCTKEDTQLHSALDNLIFRETRDLWVKKGLPLVAFKILRAPLPDYPPQITFRKFSVVCEEEGLTSGSLEWEDILKRGWKL